MNYVEWLRVRNCLKWTAIVLVVLLIVTVIVRIAVRGSMNDPMAYVHSMQQRSGARATQSMLADGTKRTEIVDSSDGTHITVDDRGYQGKRITVVEPSHGANRAPTSIVMGSINVRSVHSGSQQVVTMETNQPESFAVYLGVAAFVALIAATLLGAPFARENDGHLEIALTKPIGREQLALTTIGVDLIGVVAVWCMSIVFLILAHSIFQAPHLTFDSNTPMAAGLGLLGSTAWYAMLCAATARMKRSSGVVLGLAWPIASVIVLLGSLQLSSSAIGAAVHAIARPLSWLVPLSYMHFGSTTVGVDVSTDAASVVAAQNTGTNLLALGALALIYGALAIVAWRRVEA